jgi:pyruvate-formate lyase-activating enzyme
LQPEFLLAVLSQCKSNYMHTTVETCAHADTDLLLEVSQLTDWMFIDIKHIDSDSHRSETGVGNELILKNVETIASADCGVRLVIRVPIIPGYNDTHENLRATAVLIAKLKLQEVNLLPFHRFGESKYEQLGLEYNCAHLTSPLDSEIRRHQHIFESAGLRCYIGSETPF